MATAKKTKTPAASAAAPRGQSEVQTAIVQAARALFAKKPYADVTTRAIAQAANVNLGLLHRHFGSKEAVVRAVMEEDAQLHRDRVQPSVTPAQALLSPPSCSRSAYRHACCCRTCRSTTSSPRRVRFGCCHEAALRKMRTLLI